MQKQENLTLQYKITEINLEARREFIRLGEKDRKILISLIPWAKKVAPVLAKEFYDWQFSFGPTRQFFEKYATERGVSLFALRETLENAQAGYLLSIFTEASKNWGVSYFEGRLHIGMIHDRINLPQKWYMGSYAEYQYLTRKHLRKSFRFSSFFSGKIARAEEAIFKVFNYDQQAICDSFLLNTFESLGLSVEDIETTGSADRTEHVDQIKFASTTLLEQAQVISEQRLNDKVLETKVAGTLGAAFEKMAHNLRENHEEMQAAMTQIEANMKVAQSVVDEVNRVADLLREGKLSERAHAGDASGAFKQLVDSFNAAIDNILVPIAEALTVLERMAGGDLTNGIAGEFKGDHAKIKIAVNKTLDSLNDILGQVWASVDQVATGAGEVSSASQTLSDGATKQASSLEQTTASMQEIAAQTRQNAENAEQANQLATAARKGGEDGTGQMKMMLVAMEDINKSSDEISKIIKSIDEIAFQTNLLALNAAVEAARAGVHGKGFAVVAEEVRNLAQRSAKAAQETTQLIEGSVKDVANGSKLANQTSKALDEIVSGVAKVTDLVGEIASASKEQSLGIEQVSQGLGQIDNVTQANTASAEQSAAASEELSGQADQVKHMLGQFRLRNGGRVATSPSPAIKVVDIPKPVAANGDGWGEGPAESGNSTSISDDVIALDDDDFGGF